MTNAFALPTPDRPTPMIHIGETQTLRAARFRPPGLFLTDGESEVLLPRGEVPEEVDIGDELTVFVHTDSEDRPVATLRTPAAEVGGFGAMRIVSKTEAGAFADWGLAKDLLLPHKLQHDLLHVGQTYLVGVLLDERSSRPVGTTRLGRFLESARGKLEPGQPVQLRVWRFTENGIRVLVDDRYVGLIFHTEVFEGLNVGDVRPGFVREVRGDGKVDVTLRADGFAGVEAGVPEVLAALRDAGGKLGLHDGSPPESIYAAFGMSKKRFKRAVGVLLREGRIRLEAEGIALVEEKG